MAGEYRCTDIDVVESSQMLGKVLRIQSIQWGVIDADGNYLQMKPIAATRLRV